MHTRVIDNGGQRAAKPCEADVGAARRVGGEVVVRDGERECAAAAVGQWVQRQGLRS